MRHLKAFATRQTPQDEPIPGSEQVPNSAGGYAWPLDDWRRLDRFLVLGSEGGSYYAAERALTRENAAASLRCIDVKTRKVRWERDGFGCGSMILAEGNLIVLTERGDLVLVEATPKEYREKARAKVFRDLPCRAQIALANGRLYARDEGRLVCFDLKK